jgi:hypothetical protein
MHVIKIHPFVLILAAACAQSFCGRATAACNLETQSEHSMSVGVLKMLNLDNAAKDAAKAYASGDTQLLGVYGYSVEVPGYRGNPYAHKGMIRMLDGTGDVFCTEEEKDLNRNASA